MRTNCVQRDLFTSTLYDSDGCIEEGDITTQTADAIESQCSCDVEEGPEKKFVIVATIVNIAWAVWALFTSSKKSSVVDSSSIIDDLNFSTEGSILELDTGEIEQVKPFQGISFQEIIVGMLPSKIQEKIRSIEVGSAKYLNFQESLDMAQRRYEAIAIDPKTRSYTAMTPENRTFVALQEAAKIIQRFIVKSS